MKHVTPRDAERAAEREAMRATMEAQIEAWIAALDALDAEDDEREPDGESDLADDEPSLGWTALMNQERAMCFGPDVGEHEGECGGDDEQSLGWAANGSQAVLGDNTADGDLTAPERHGRGFVRCGADDLEDGADREGVNEDGGDILDEPHDVELDLEPEDYVGGYTEDVLRRFRFADVWQAGDEARRQARGAMRPGAFRGRHTIGCR